MSVDYNIKKGDQFGRWTVLRESSRDVHGRARFAVRCVCGVEAVVPAVTLKHNGSKGCRFVSCRNQYKKAQAAATS